MRTYLNLSTVIGAIAVAHAGLALADEPPTCPKTFPVHSLPTATTSDGWLADTGFPAPLDGIAVFDGPPDQRGMLKPWDATDFRVTWRFAPPYPEGLWMQCSYGDGMLTLSRRLGDVPESCTARYGPERRGKPRAIDFKCH